MHFKAKTIEQFKILTFIEEIFDVDYISVELKDRYTVQLTDMDGASICYIYKDGKIIEQEDNPHRERSDYMDMREFNSTWEVEYICERVRQITQAVENGNYETALDYLRMIREKAKAAEYLIKYNPA